MANPVLLRAFLDMAKTRGRPWLANLRDEAAEAVAAGDIEFTSVGFEGGTGTGSRKFNAAQTLELAQQALEEFDDNSQQVGVIPSFGQIPH